MIVSGIYKHGRIQLLETPTGIREGRVRLLVLEEPGQQTSSGQMRLGQFAGDVLPTEEDFKIAEWHGEDKYSELNGAP